MTVEIGNRFGTEATNIENFKSTEDFLSATLKQERQVMQDLNEIIDTIERKESSEDMFYSLYSIPKYYNDEE